jgi:phosphatidylglycerol---prolipoprotein diacylglyceryl transferase
VWRDGVFSPVCGAFRWVWTVCRVCSKVVSFLFQPAVIFSGAAHLGPLRVSVYGVFAAVGLLAALGVGQWSAKLARLTAESIWDVGLFALTAAFVISRVMLVVQDAHTFVLLPWVVLALPSFTYSGMALTAVAVVVYVWWKRLPVLAVMDAWAPGAALLAGALSLGHYFEGTDAGMPTSLPWGVHAPGIGRVQPVQLYGLAGSVVLFAVLMGMLRRRLRPGVVAGVALVVGGVMAFLLAMMTQPVDWGGSAWLEPGQWIAIGAVVMGGLLLMRMKERA